MRWGEGQRSNSSERSSAAPSQRAQEHPRGEERTPSSTAGESGRRQQWEERSVSFRRCTVMRGGEKGELTSSNTPFVSYS